VSVTQRALTYFIKTNNAAGLSLFLELGANVEVRLPAFDMSHLDRHDLMGDDLDIAPIPLLIVADMDLVPLARIFLEHGAKVEYLKRKGYGKFSPLHAARSPEMVHALLDHNADPDLKDEKGNEPLVWYAARDDITTMRAILERGANPNPNTYWGQPLHEAAQRSLAATKLLVKHGAHVNAKDFNGNIPLHLAAAHGLTDVVKFLLECWPEGARNTNLTPDLPTPLHHAAAFGRIESVRLLLEVWPEGKEALNKWGLTPFGMFKRFSRFSRFEPELPEVVQEMGDLLGSV
jgi:ankyrin repeat protein